MKVGVLLSGGKDSLYAAYKAAAAGYELSCCLSMKSENAESYMFHTPHIEGVHLQAEAMNIPLLVQTTQGEKETELDDLFLLLKNAKEHYGIQGVTTGAVGSQYQAARIQTLCAKLGLHCFNPLWQINQVQLLEELLEHQFTVIFTGVFAYPLTESWLGRQLTKESIEELQQYEERYCLNPAGEGGELESYVLDCPLFQKRIHIEESTTHYENYSGTVHISKAKLKEKTPQQLQKITAFPKEGDILVVSCVDPQLQLYEEEMIRPILAELKNSRVIHLNELRTPLHARAIILSGTGILDDAFLAHKEKIQQLLLKTTIPILGICAGAELLLPEDHELDKYQEIGPQQVELLNENKITQALDGTTPYFLHHLGLRAIPFTSPLQGLLATTEGIAAFKYRDKNIYGIQFHPEVSCKDVLHKFIQL